MAKALSSLKIPGFRWLLLGQALSLQGTWIQGTAQRWLVLELSDSPFHVGMLGAVSGLPILLFSFFGGYLSDRFSRFSVLFFAHSLILAHGVFLALLIASGHITIAILIATGFFLGTGMAFEVPARQGLVFDLVGRDGITNALALHSTAFNLARFLGPAVAGYLMEAGLTAACFAIKAVTAMGVMGAICLIYKRNYVGEKYAAKAAPPHMKDGLVFAWRHPTARMVLLTILTFGTLLLPHSVLLPSLGRDVLGLGAREYGLLCAANGLGALTGAIFVAFFGHKGERTRWWWVGAVVFPCSLIAVGLMKGFFQASLVLYVSGFFMVICANSAISLIQIIAPDHLRGQLMGIFTTSFMGFFPIGCIMTGALADTMGVQATLLIQGGVALCVVLFLRFVFRPVQ